MLPSYGSTTSSSGYERPILPSFFDESENNDNEFTSLLGLGSTYDGYNSPPLSPRQPTNPRLGRMGQNIKRAVRAISPPLSPTRSQKPCDPISVRIVISNSFEGADVFHTVVNVPMQTSA
mmetsp:Transcript_17370/g.24539  ORF Transcript_17370/g.24539 Transcript_17370/m.24539 type:complete len:120 (+) Transcript_17370:169-528(+)